MAGMGTDESPDPGGRPEDELAGAGLVPASPGGEGTQRRPVPPVPADRELVDPELVQGEAELPHGPHLGWVGDRHVAEGLVVEGEPPGLEPRPVDPPARSPLLPQFLPE